MEPTAIQPYENRVDDVKYNFTFYSYEGDIKNQVNVNQLRGYLTETHKRSLKTHRYMLKLDDFILDPYKLSCIGHTILEFSTYYMYELGDNNLYHNVHAKRISDFIIRVGLKEYINYLEEDKINASFGFHADIMFVDSFNKVYINIYPIFYFQNEDDRLLFKLRF